MGLPGKFSVIKSTLNTTTQSDVLAINALRMRRLGFQIVKHHTPHHSKPSLK